MSSNTICASRTPGSGAALPAARQTDAADALLRSGGCVLTMTEHDRVVRQLAIPRLPQAVAAGDERRRFVGMSRTLHDSGAVTLDAGEIDGGTKIVLRVGMGRRDVRQQLVAGLRRAGAVAAHVLEIRSR